MHLCFDDKIYIIMADFL